MTIPQISVQLYSVYQQSEADLHETLGRLADIGLPNVEAFDIVRRVDAPKTAFAQQGLEAPTAHAVLTEDDIATPDGLPTAPTPQQVLAAAVHLAVSILIDPSAQPAGQGDVPLAAALAAGTTIDSAVIEFDHYAGDHFDGIAASCNYLTSLEN